MEFIIIILIIFAIYYIFVKPKTSTDNLGPSTSFSRQFQINYDKDVAAPLKLLKSKLTDHDYRENYDRIASEFTIGFIHGLMGYATFQNHNDMEDYDRVMERVSPFTDTILSQVFSEKEAADLRMILHSNLTSSKFWQEGFEWGWRDCESWQQAGEVTLTWLDYIRNENQSKFSLL